MRRHFHVLAAGLAFALIGKEPAITGPRNLTARDDDVRRWQDLEYACAGEQSLRLDLYLPEGGGERLPLVVWIHGGAWRAGDKAAPPARGLLDTGIAVASINYRLSQQAPFPAQIEDCKAAIRWLRTSSRKYGIDSERIGVWGSSAGGHLAALLGTSGGVPDLEGKVGGNLQESSRVQAVCDWFGPTDFLQMNAHAGPDGRLDHDAADSPESLLVGGAIQRYPEKVKRANPITYVSADDPPFLIMHGDRDALVPIHQSQLLFESLRKAGVNVEFQTVRGAGHGFGGPANVGRAASFFRRTLRARARKQPNEILILSDDPGYGDRGGTATRPFRL